MNGYLKVKQYSELFYDKKEAIREYENIKDECVCDSTEWKYITRKYIREGVYIMVEFDSIKTNEHKKIEFNNIKKSFKIKK